MYYYIKGQLVHKENGLVVVDCGGVGYQMFASMSTVSLIGEVGDVVTAYSYLYIREGIMDLYGFFSIEEKNMFIQLIGISGIGPKAALSILSVAPPSRLALAIIADDYKLIQSAPGVGAKTAQRVVLELKDKLKDFQNLDNVEINQVFSPVSDNFSEAVSALIVLGYSDKEAAQAVKGIDGSLSTDEILKQALKNLA